jgi:polysaccharide export outer membrane protein
VAAARPTPSVQSFFQDPGAGRVQPAPVVQAVPAIQVARAARPDPVPAASVGLPVPLEGEPGPNTAVASTWEPAQRVEVEQAAYAPEGAPPPLTTSRAAIDIPPARPQPIASTGPTTGIVVEDPGLPPPPPPGPPVAPVVAGPVHGGHPIAGRLKAVPAPVPGVPREFEKQTLPNYVIEPPDILLIESTQDLPDQRIRGQHLVTPDGYVRIGIYGSVFVAGLTIDQARSAIAEQLGKRIEKFDIKSLSVDVLAYNSKVYYVITDGAGFGEQVYRIPYTGNETVLDAIAQINGLPTVASKKKIWLARATPGDHGVPHKLPIDWCGITQGGLASTNYQIFPGDRVYVASDTLISIDSWLGKVLNPIERVLGATLLGSSTVNSIRSGGTGTGTGTGGFR